VYKENPEKIEKIEKFWILQFCLFGGFQAKIFFPQDSSDDFSTERPVFTAPRPTLTRFQPKTCFFFVILAVFSLSLFASLRLWNSETLRLWNSETLRL